jgi:thiamin-phosphate kinase
MTNRDDPASGEDTLIARYFKPLASDPGAFNLVDDAAILKTPGEDIVATTDAIVEGVHFLADDPPDTIARKALRVNLSDLAAKGATPAGFVLTLALRRADDAWLTPFAQALGEDATHFSCPLLGGDTVSTPGPLMISITAFGRAPAGRMVRRSGAKPGDRVMVTGTIGDAWRSSKAARPPRRSPITARQRQCSSRATGCRSRAARSLARSVNTLTARWTYPMDLPVISPNSARHPMYPPRSMRRAFPCLR